jgi:hypothetical protein
VPQTADRIARLPGAEKSAPPRPRPDDPEDRAAPLGLDGGLISGEMSRETAE